jgi:hypothetical protein
VGEGALALLAGAAARRVLGRAPLQRDREAATPQGQGTAGAPPGVAARPLAPADALARLALPHALEDFSPLTGAPALIVDLRTDAGPPDDAATARARTTLGTLPCPTIAVIGSPPARAAAALADHFDVLVESDTDLAPILAAIDAHPLASMALVQCLRGSDGRNVHEGLILESLVYSTLQSGPELQRWLAAHRRDAAAPSDPEPPVLVAREGARLDVTLNRPARHNAFSVAMRDALAAALQLAVADLSVREIVLGGRGPSFCSGGDLAEFGTLPDPATAHAIRSTRNCARLLAACAERVRAEVHGACVGAGTELAAFAARVVARADAFFQLPEVGMGLVPGAGCTVSLPRRIGRQRTAYLALTGARIDAPTALAWGLVDEIR